MFHSPPPAAAIVSLSNSAPRGQCSESACAVRHSRHNRRQSTISVKECMLRACLKSSTSSPLIVRHDVRGSPPVCMGAMEPLASSAGAPLSSTSATPTLVHEPQQWRRCGLHATNNILQLPGDSFTLEDFESIADTLQPGGDCCGNDHKAGCKQGMLHLILPEPVSYHHSSHWYTQGTTTSTSSAWHSSVVGRR